MSGKKILIIFAGICLLLVSAVILNPSTQHTSLISKEENSSESNNSNERDIFNSFIINNWGNANHKVNVELLDSKNNSESDYGSISDENESSKNNSIPDFETSVYLKA